MEMNNKLVLLLFSLSLVLINLCEGFDYHEKELETEEGLEAMYERWRKHHDVAEKSPERFNKFKATAHLVHNHNKMDKSFKVSLNRYAAMTDEEKAEHSVGESLKAASPCRPAHPDINNLPPRFDWRESNAVTRPRIWEKCGQTAMLVSTAGAIESINAIRTGELLDLSPQFFIECGWCRPPMTVPDIAKMIDDQGGVPLEENFPMTGYKGTTPCDKALFGRVMVTIDGIDVVRVDSEEQMKKLLMTQPLLFYIDGGPLYWSYRGGIYNDDGKVKEAKNMYMLLVGYDQNAQGEKYWIARGTLATWWGDKGYMYLPMNRKDMYEYVCIVNKSIETRNAEL